MFAKYGMCFEIQFVEHSYDKTFKKRFHVQNTEKKDCPATISIKHVLKFPENKVRKRL
jgi:hypothetical protein